MTSIKIQLQLLLTLWSNKLCPKKSQRWSLSCTLASFKCQRQQLYRKVQGNFYPSISIRHLHLFKQGSKISGNLYKSKIKQQILTCCWSRTNQISKSTEASHNSSQYSTLPQRNSYPARTSDQVFKPSLWKSLCMQGRALTVKCHPKGNKYW